MTELPDRRRYTEPVPASLVEPGTLRATPWLVLGLYAVNAVLALVERGC